MDHQQESSIKIYKKVQVIYVMKWNNTTKEVISHISAQLMLLFGMILVIWGFITPPEGEVHASVQLIFGQVLVFTGAIFGVSLHYDNKAKTMFADLEDKMLNKIHEEVHEEIESHETNHEDL